jgi:hypothetical protein
MRLRSRWRLEQTDMVADTTLAREAAKRRNVSLNIFPSLEEGNSYYHGYAAIAVGSYRCPPSSEFTRQPIRA